MKIPKFLIKLTGDVRLSKRPLFISYRPRIHKVKGFEVRQILDVIEPGDILLRRYDGYLNTIFTPGFWGHAGLVITDRKVIHAIGKGVIQEDVLDFCRADSVVVLRVKYVGLIESAIEMAKKLERERTAYDYEFRSNDKAKKVYCTELVDFCYNNIFNKDYKIVARNNVLIPEGIRFSISVKTIIEFRHGDKTKI